MLQPCSRCGIALEQASVSFVAVEHGAAFVSGLRHDLVVGDAAPPW
ncbi:MAG: hypothetical protein H7Z41_05735 [Cytophagales bacterium]|nr:hypothetical protein [Armatimonadota bacterium]